MQTHDDPATHWRIEFLSKEGIVRATATGDLDLVLVTQKAAETLREADDHAASRFLIDDREAELRLDTVEIYQLPGILERLGLPRTAKLAVVYTVTSPTAADFKFFETVALNQGFHVRLFTVLDEAIDWLTREGEVN